MQLTDFGIARQQDATAMTQTGMVMGTIRYLAPEVAQGGPATERSDLYAAGGVIREVAGDDPPPRLRELVEALTADDPERRPSSADDALARLDESAMTQPLTPLRGEQTRPTAPLERAKPAVQALDEVIRRPWFVPAAGIAAVVLLAVIVIALAAGGGDGGGGDATTSPAPASAPLDEQLRGLDRAIDAAASR